MQTGVNDNEGTTPKSAPKETERVGPPSPCKGDQEIKEAKPKDDAIPADEDEGIVVAAPEPGTKKKLLSKDEGIAT
ncbi:F-box and leucine-rich repeat protein 7 [Colletotrichum sp. SAR11_59]|nr:F-box and leucine-rich repeat protein 7 [Colletotrichum sp. SAR11_59]